MITKDTVLVLGAGASLPYGFPSGPDLIDIIGEAGHIPPRVLQKMQELHPNRSEIALTAEELCPPVDKILGGQVEGAKFRSQLTRSQVYSIDAFLAENDIYRKAGLRAMAEVLLRCEGRFPAAGDWYRELFNRLIAKDPHQEGKLTIITFNYDRSLEWYLFHSYLAYMKEHEVTAAWQNVGKIDFIHVYGSLGKINPQIAGTEPIVPYGDYGQAEVSASLMNIIRGGNSARSYDLIEKALVDAHLLAFIGFSFDPMNLDALGVPMLEGEIAPSDIAEIRPWNSVKGKIWATCHNLQEPVKEHAQERLGPIIWKDVKALPFVREHRILA